MKKILIVEDDISIHEILETLLEKENYFIYNAYSGTEALLLLERENIDLILLDLMLPGINGEEIINLIKGIPIIVLSAKASVDDKVNCLLSGAVDFISKPFDSKELLARIEVQLRSKNSISDSLKFKELELLNDKHTLLVSKCKVNLTRTEYAIMKQLLLNPQLVIPKNKLLELIRLDTDDCDEGSLRVHIINLRKKIRMYTDRDYIDYVCGICFNIREKF